jgi:dTDP-4-dehydrorhamnose 3,5-epimerase
LRIINKINDLYLIEENVYSDNRGLFFENYNKLKLKELLGFDLNFVQDNISLSNKNVLRGLHYQIIKPQGKYIRVIKGAIWDVVVDIRKDSKNYGKSFNFDLNDENNNCLYIPEGYAHGFVSKADKTIVMYKTTEFYYPEYDRTLLWSDPDININWPVKNPILSDKDKLGINFNKLDY